MGDPICIWTEDYDENVWDTSCGGKFTLDDGTPCENDMEYCCYCGARLKEHRQEHTHD